MDTVRRYENGQINYEPKGEEIVAFCPMCGHEVEILEWECNNLKDNNIVTIIGGYCNNCSSIINEKILDIEVKENEL